jgi:uncharacterized protein (DUF58 family)
MKPWLAAGVCLLAAGLVFQSIWLGVMATVALATGSISLGWSRLALVGVSYRRRLAEGALFAGEQAHLELRVANDKPLPLAWLRIRDNVATALEFDRPLEPSPVPRTATLTHLVSLLPYESVTWRYTLRCRRRGFYFLGPAELDSGDIFGLHPRQAQLSDVQRVVVYPAVRPLAELGFPPGDPFGGQASSRPLHPDPLRPRAIRDYQPGDARRQVHWKATAKYRALKVKVLESVRQPGLLILVNTATFAREWMGVEPDLQERVIEVAASIAQHGHDHRYAIGLLANGNVPGSRRPISVGVSRHPDCLTRILESLAAVTSYVSLPFERLLDNACRRLAWGVTVVAVSAVVSAGLEAALLRVRRAGHPVVLVSLDHDYVSSPPNVTTYHLDAAAQAKVSTSEPSGRGRGQDSDAGRRTWARPVGA